MKFRTRLFLLYIGGVCLTVLLLAAYFINFEENRVRRSIEQELLIQAKVLAENFAGRVQSNTAAELGTQVAIAGEDTGARITIVDPTGVVRADSAQDPHTMENHKNRPEIRMALKGQPGFSSRFSVTIKRNLFYAAYPLMEKSRIIGVIRVARSQNDLNQLLLRMKLLILAGVGVTAILALLSGFVAIRQIIQPIQELQRFSVSLSQGDLNARIHEFGHDELADLGLAFNRMAKQLSDSFVMLREEKRKLEVILENLADGILVVDPKLQLVLANQTAQEMLGLNPNQLLGRPIMEAVMNHHLLEMIQEVTSVKQPFESELAVHYPQPHQFQVFLAPLKDEISGLLVGSIVVLHDLTQLRRLERVRQDFVANVSHELRTPITTIKAMSETLLGGAWQDQEMLMRYLRATDQESDRLSNLVNDLLVLARLDSRVETVFEPFDLESLIKEVKERFTPKTNKASHFEINLPKNKLPLGYGSKDQIKQVLINLLDNAFKYTPADGQIRLSAWLDGEMIKVAIADTGIGIPENELGRIFERFYRVDKARSRDMGGTGLGLSIVKHIIESHGGKVEVESSLNHGSVFSFTVPTEK